MVLAAPQARLTPLPAVPLVVAGGICGGHWSGVWRRRRRVGGRPSPSGSTACPPGCALHQRRDPVWCRRAPFLCCAHSPPPLVNGDDSRMLTGRIETSHAISHRRIRCVAWVDLGADQVCCASIAAGDSGDSALDVNVMLPRCVPMGRFASHPLPCSFLSSVSLIILRSVHQSRQPGDAGGCRPAAHGVLQRRRPRLHPGRAVQHGECVHNQPRGGVRRRRAPCARTGPGDLHTCGRQRKRRAGVVPWRRDCASSVRQGRSR